MTSLSIDFETRATVDLKKTGVYPYAMHHETDIWCMAWAFDDEEPEIWTPYRAVECDCWKDDNGTRTCHCGEVERFPVPQRVVDHIISGGEIRAWNAQFERVIWNEIMEKRYGAINVNLDQWVCTAAEAAAMSLPRSLDQCARVVKVQEQKDDEGYRLMMRMTRPRKVHDDGTIEWWDVEDRKQRLYDYCKQDVRTERAIAKCLRRLTPREREVYVLDQIINDRGIPVDRELVQAASDLVEDGVLRANQQLARLTGGDVTEITNHARLRTWLGTQGVATDSVSKAAVRALLERDDLAAEVRDALTLRADAGRSSIAKLGSLLECACEDDRLRGLTLYHGAGTGRWTGRLVQPHNFPRGEVDDIESFVPAVLARNYDAIDVIAHPIVVVLSMLRCMLVASPGHDLIAADFSAIEARVLNWLAGQEDILDLFRRGEDVYKHNAAKLYRIPLGEVQKFPHRQTGKFQELGCGYQMGAKKAVSAAKDVYGLDLTKEQAKEVVDSYRSSHLLVKQFWFDADSAVKRAVERPGEVQYFGAKNRLRAVVAGAYLYIVLPSGRPLCYAAPKLVLGEQPWCSACGVAQDEHGPEHVYEPAKRWQVQAWAVNGYTKQWEPFRFYGGLIAENVTQAVSRDLLAEAMFRAEAAGYPVVLHVHDELVSEVPKGYGSVEEYEQLLAALPAWAEGCPVAAEGWRGERYRK